MRARAAELGAPRETDVVGRREELLKDVPRVVHERRENALFRRVDDSPIGLNAGVPVQEQPPITSAGGSSIDVAEAYAACGGPMPEPAICHRRKK